MDFFIFSLFTRVHTQTTFECNAFPHIATHKQREATGEYKKAFEGESSTCFQEGVNWLKEKKVLWIRIDIKECEFRPNLMNASWSEFSASVATFATVNGKTKYLSWLCARGAREASLIHYLPLSMHVLSLHLRFYWTHSCIHMYLLLCPQLDQ